MNAYTYSNPSEKVLSGAAAVAMHLLFLALLVFGVSWKRTVEPQANIVDLWANLPSATQPKVEPAPPEPPPPQPVRPPKVEPPPPAPPKAEVKPEIAKPDIAMKEKAEKEKVEKEKAEKAKAEKERRVLEDQKQEAKKRDETKQLEAKKAADAERAAKEQQELQAKLAQQQAATQAAQIDKYKRAISDKIKRFIVLPPNLQGNPEAEFDVVILPGGEVLNVKMRKSSGNAPYDRAVEIAINKAQPLPLPSDPAMLKDFRELNMKFRPQE